MSEHRIHFQIRDTDSPEVRARLEKLNVNEYPRERADAISDRTDWVQVRARVHRIRHEHGSIRTRILAVWALAQYLSTFTTGLVACKRGCSHCCHIPVSLTKDEAQIIGERIGRKPASPPPQINAEHIDWGYHNPCPFLRDGECSIYDSRPLACRLHYSVDVDDLLCRLVPPYGIPVPYMNMTAITALLFEVSSRGGMPHYADIREWFPPTQNRPAPHAAILSDDNNGD